MNPVPRRYWFMGISAALAVHALIAAVVYWHPPESGAREAGRSGVQLSLGPAGGSPGEAVEVDGVAEVENVKPEATDEQAVTAVKQATPAESLAEQAETAEPVVAATITPVETLESPAHVPLPVPQAPEATHDPEAAETAADPEPQSTEASTPSVAGAGGKAGSGETTDAGNGDNAAGGGTPGASPDYMARLRAWLEKHKRYPRSARLRRQEGTAMLSFVIDREGRVMEYSIRESSGHRILDEEVAAMIERAQPLPGFPDDLQRSRLELVVPVQFFLM
jgi:periplasmic protein TonB